METSKKLEACSDQLKATSDENKKLKDKLSDTERISADKDKQLSEKTTKVDQLQGELSQANEREVSEFLVICDYIRRLYLDTLYM